MLTLRYVSLPLALLLALVCATPAQAQIQVPTDPPSPPAGENVCPSENIDGGRSAVDHFLTPERRADKREKAGVTNLSMDDVRPLNSTFYEEDAAICEQLDEKYSESLNDYDEPFGAVYLKGGGRYFVYLYPTLPERYPDDTIVMGIKFFDVLDENLNVILGYAGG